MRTEAQRAVSRARRSLNAIALLSGGLLWLAPAAVAAGLLLLVLEAAGRMPPGSPALAVWGMASALAFCGGALAALRRRLDDRAAAAWLDERLMTRELLSAALGLSRPGRRPGRFDEEVAERAEAAAAAPAARHPGWPFAALLRRALPAAAACLALPAILVWADPSALGNAFRAGGSEGGGDRLEVAAGQRSAARQDGALALASGADAAAVARFLFAEDPAGAEAAERALREGRAEEFRNLLERAVRDLDSRLSRGVNDDERERLLEEKRRLEEALSAMDESTWSGGSSGGSSLERSSSGSSRAGPEGGPAGQVSGEGDSSADSSSRSPPQRRTGKGEAAQVDGGSGKGGSRQDTPGDGDGKAGKGAAPGTGPGSSPGGELPPGGKDPSGGKGPSGGSGPGPGSPDQAGKGPDGEGEGSGSGPAGGGNRPGDAGAASGSGEARDRGKLSPSASGGILTVAPDRAASFFDYVLKGRDPGAALPGLARQAARAAEAPIANEGLPLEYEDFLRSYFLALARQLEEGAAAQGVSPATKGAP